MKIISWNVNGLRALHKKGLFLEFIAKHKPDILCLQETKASEAQLPNELKYIGGYNAFFSSSQEKKGYSGVALYVNDKLKPYKIEYGFGVKRFDKEGRTAKAEFKDFILFNVYFPNGGQGPHRLKYKLEFYDAFLKRIDALKRKGRKVIFCGDVNTAHHEIDLARPKSNIKNTGFLPIERAWLDKVEKHKWVDVFRYFHPNKKDAYTYWDIKSRARERNVGWRLDYFFASKNLIKKISGTKILTNAYGSDHAPIQMILK